MKTSLSILTLLLVSACSSGPSVPDWQLDTQSAMARYSQQYLEGRSKLAAASFDKARNATSATADIAAVAHLELIKCGIAMAALNSAPCSAYTRLAPSNTVDANYYRLLTGDFQHIDKQQIPSQYQAWLMSKNTNDINTQLNQISNPVSRLIATSLSILHRPHNATTVQIGIDTASAQGWRRPLLAYLLLQQKNNTDPLQQQQIQTRIELLQSSLIAQ
ncbi:MAG: hypothetical protein HOP20_00765 [Sulfuriferula sp.]|nr:hypothetical protein [Sulfuriferula sp.]